MQVDVTGSRSLRFADGTPVRAASAIAPLGSGWLVAQDDATHAAWWTPRSIERIRLFQPVEGHDVFSEAAGTKRLKPDLEAACPVLVHDTPAVLALGSGSTPARMRGALVSLLGNEVEVVVADLSPLYAAVAAALGISPSEVNLEGACRAGDTLRWFNRGNLHAGVPSASVDLDLGTLVPAVLGQRRAEEIVVGSPARYELGEVDGVGLAVTDAVALGDGRILLSAAAEDTPNAVDDGPVVAAALALLEAGHITAIAPLPSPEGAMAHKVEGLALRGIDGDVVSLLAVIDADDPDEASIALDLAVRPG